MRISIYKCDGCLNEIEGKIYLSSLETVDRKTGDYDSQDTTFSEELAKVHYCTKCAEDIFVKLMQYHREEPKEEPEKETEKELEQALVEVKPKKKSEPKKVNKTPIDHRKAWALKKAGWTIEQIWDEFGKYNYSRTSVYTAIMKGKAEEENGKA